jgi:hypothetical protein
MLKQLENLLRQQDKEQKQDIAEDPEGPAAAAGEQSPAAPAEASAPAAPAEMPAPAVPAKASSPDAPAEVPAPAAEPEAEAPAPTTAVEVASETVVDPPPDPSLEVAGDAVEADVPEAQSLQVETVPSEEDRHEIGAPQPSEAAGAGGGEGEVETPPQDTTGPASVSGDMVKTEAEPVESKPVGDKPIGFAPTRIEVVKDESSEAEPIDAGATEQPLEEAPPPEESSIEVEAADSQPIEAEASAAEAVPEGDVAGSDEAVPAADADDSEALPDGRRRFSLGDLLHLGNNKKDESVEEEATAPAGADPAGGGEPVADGPPGKDEEVSLDSPDVGQGPPTGHEAADPVVEQSEPAVEETVPAAEEPPVDDEDVAEVAAAQMGSTEAEPSADLDDAVGSDAATEAPNEDDESPASKYPAWWFRGGSVHTYEEDAEGDSPEAEVDDEGRPVETPSVTADRAKLPVEPFVQHEEVVDPPLVRKSISEQLAEEGEEPEPIAAVEDDDTEESDLPGELAVGVEGLSAVQSASDSAVEDEPERAEGKPRAMADEPEEVAEAPEVLAEETAVVDLEAEPAAEEIDPAQALKIVESLADIAARRGSGAGGEVAAPDAPGQQEDTSVDVPQIPVIDVQVDGTTADEEPDPVDVLAADQVPAGEVPAAPRREAEQVGEPVVATPAEKAAPARPEENVPERPRRRLTARLGTLLLDAHLIAEKDLERALKEHQVTGERLGYYLVDKGMVDEVDLARVLSDQYGVPAADLENADIPAGVLGLISEKMARRYMVLPIAVSEGAIDVAMVDPADVNAIQDIEFATGLRAQPLIATEWAVERAIHRLYAPEAMRTALSGRTAKRSKLKDPRAIIKRIVRDRDEAVMQADDDPHRAYELAASLDDFVDELLRVARKVQED